MATYETATRGTERSDWERRGYSQPFRLLDAPAAAQLAERIRRGPAPLDWLKGAAATSPAVWALATDPGLVARVTDLLGPDVLLCGANLVERDPGQVHPWHTDTHLAAPEGRALSVWVALEGVTASSALQVIAGSHDYGAVPQQLAAEADGDVMVDEATALEMARRFDPAAVVDTIDMADGEAVLFDEALWHGTRNTGRGVRSALVLHYATPDKPVRIHRHGQVWPFEFLDDPLPPCQVVAGVDGHGVNRLAPPPGGVGLNRVLHVADLDLDGPDGWKPYPAWKGPTSQLADLAVKVIRVYAAEHEHAPHSHDEETVGVQVEGRTQVSVGSDELPLQVELGPGDSVFLPSGVRHGWADEADPERSVQVDVTYRGWAPASTGTSTGTGRVRLGVSAFADAAVATDQVDLDERGRSAVVLCDGATDHLERLRMLRVDLAPGFVGEPDVDDYDVVLVVRSGRIATLDDEAGPGDIVLYGAGETHRLATVGVEPAVLTVIELKGRSGRPERPSDGVRGAVSAVASLLGSPTRAGALGVGEVRRRIVRRMPRSVRLAVRRLRRRLVHRAL